MDVPTPASVRAASQLEWDDLLGYAEEDPDPLLVLVARSVAYVEMMTGRSAASIDAAGFLAPLYEQSVQLRTEQLAFRSQHDASEAANDDTIISFSAGGYSETRSNPQQRGKTIVINENPTLAQLLWMLMTPTKQDEWQVVVTGKQAPGSAVQEIDWVERYGPYEALPGVGF